MKKCLKKIACMALAAVITMTSAMVVDIPAYATEETQLEQDIELKRVEAERKGVRGNDCSIAPGETAQLSGSSSYYTGTWKSNRPSVATVSSTGLVTGVKKGVAKITYEYAGYQGKICTRDYCVTVTGKDFYGPGEYVVGKSIPAGTYVCVFDSEVYTSFGYWERYKKRIVANEIFYNTSIIKVKKGEKFELSGCYAIPFTKASKSLFKISNINKKNHGAVVVGQKGFKAGTYKFTPQKVKTTNGVVKKGSVAVYRNAEQKYKKGDTNKSSKKSFTLKLKKGQYVYIYNCSVKKVK